MVDHYDNLGDAAADERLKTYKQNNLRHQRIRRLAELYEVGEGELLAMTKLSWVMRGCICYTLANQDTYTLDEPMTDWWGDHTDIRDDLLDKGLVTQRRDKLNRRYYEVTNEGYDLLPETWRFDIGESFKHRLAVGRTAALYRLQDHNIKLYPEIDDTGTSADLLIYPDDEQARRDMDIPGRKPVYVEVMTDHHNTAVVEDRFKTLENSPQDALWVMENQETANKWLRRLQNRSVMDFEKEYTWHPRTPTDAMRERVRATEYTGMQDVVTFNDIRDKLAYVYAKDARISKGLPAPPRRPDGTRQMLEQIQSVLNA